MKAPEQNHSAIEPKGQRINYSMLPPEKLPSWLLKENAPPKIDNYSMRPPGALPQFVEPIQEIVSAPPQLQTLPPVVPPAPAEPIVLERPQVVEPEMILVQKRTVIEEVPALTPEISASVEDLPKNNTPDPLEASITQTKPILVVETPAPAEQPSTIQTETPIPPLPIWEAPIPPQATAPQGHPFNGVPQTSNSFGDWILNNSNITMIIVVGIILFAIVLIVLLSLGVI